MSLMETVRKLEDVKVLVGNLLQDFIPREILGVDVQASQNNIRGIYEILNNNMDETLECLNEIENKISGDILESLREILALLEEKNCDYYDIVEFDFEYKTTEQFRRIYDEKGGFDEDASDYQEEAHDITCEQLDDLLWKCADSHDDVKVLLERLNEELEGLLD